MKPRAMKPRARPPGPAGGARPAALLLILASSCLAMLPSAPAKADAPPDRYLPGTGEVNTVYDRKTNLTWQLATSPAASYGSAAGACTKADAGLAWRLPTVKELLSLVDTTPLQPLPKIHPVFLNTVYGLYWTSSAVLGQETVWLVDFQSGGTKQISVDGNAQTPLYVRCVRTGR